MSSCCRKNPAAPDHQILVCKAMKGDAGANAVLRNRGLDWTTMYAEQRVCQQKKNQMTYGAIAGLGALAYFMSKGKK
jgi:hypothetical protein